MASAKDKNVVCVVKGLTDRQAAKLVGEISRAKNKIAPDARATAAVTTREKIASLLSAGRVMITEG